MIAAHGEQRTNQRIAAETVDERVGLVLTRDLHHSGEARTVELDEQTHRRTRDPAHFRIAVRIQYLQHALKLFARRPKRQGLSHHSARFSNVGACRVSIVLPSPRYMCTPQGRHGSKLRTARMMSMPLKLSRP